MFGNNVLALAGLKTEIFSVGFFTGQTTRTRLLPAHCKVRSNAREEKSCEWEVFYTDGTPVSAHLTGYGKSLAEGLYFQLCLLLVELFHLLYEKELAF